MYARYINIIMYVDIMLQKQSNIFKLMYSFFYLPEEETPVIVKCKDNFLKHKLRSIFHMVLK